MYIIKSIIRSAFLMMAVAFMPSWGQDIQLLVRVTSLSGNIVCIPNNTAIDTLKQGEIDARGAFELIEDEESRVQLESFSPSLIKAFDLLHEGLRLNVPVRKEKNTSYYLLKMKILQQSLLHRIQEEFPNFKIQIKCVKVFVAYEPLTPLGHLISVLPPLGKDDQIRLHFDYHELVTALDVNLQVDERGG